MRRALLVVGCLSLLVIMGTSSVAIAGPPDSVTMVSTSNLDPSVTATWSATGAFVDSGPIVGVVRVTGFESPGTVTAHAEDLRIGTDGAFDLRLQDRLVAVEGPILTLEGRWVIASGTGAYAGIHGTGTSVTTVNLVTGVVMGTMWGAAHFD